MDNVIKEQVMKVRSSGKVNMLDIPGVQKVANDLNLYDLVVLLSSHQGKKIYVDFIFGK